MGIYLPEKVNITFKVRSNLMSAKLKSITVLLCDFSTKNEHFQLSLFVVEVMFNL